MKRKEEKPHRAPVVSLTARRIITEARATLSAFHANPERFESYAGDERPGALLRFEDHLLNRVSRTMKPHEKIWGRSNLLLLAALDDLAVVLLPVQRNLPFDKSAFFTEGEDPPDLIVAPENSPFALSPTAGHLCVLRWLPLRIPLRMLRIFKFKRIARIPISPEQFSPFKGDLQQLGLAAESISQRRALQERWRKLMEELIRD
jgi:hypothetical protein